MVVDSAADSLDRIFFYGTLRTGQAARSLISGHIRESEPAVLQGRLYAFDDGYPGVLLDHGNGGDGSRVVGEVVVLSDLPAAFALLDAYEGDDFQRVRTEAELADGGRVSTWCYVLASDALADEGELVPGGDWVSYDRDA